MNLVILKGRLTKSPTLLFSKSGTGYTIINVAVDRYSKDKDSNADFINCTAFGKTAELIAEYFRKGQEILLKGNIKTDFTIGLDNQRIGVTGNIGYDTKGHNVRGGVGLRVIF